MDGEWYHRTARKLRPITEKSVNNPLIDFIIPLKMYVDKTGCVSNEQFCLEPVVFSTTILKNKFNQNSTSYFLLGYMTDLSNVSLLRKPTLTKPKMEEATLSEITMLVLRFCLNH